MILGPPLGTSKIEKTLPKEIAKVRGPTSKPVVFLPLSDSPPLKLPLKGTRLNTPPAACIRKRFPEYIPVEAELDRKAQKAMITMMNINISQ